MLKTDFMLTEHKFVSKYHSPYFLHVIFYNRQAVLYDRQRKNRSPRTDKNHGILFQTDAGKGF